MQTALMDDMMISDDDVSGAFALDEMLGEFADLDFTFTSETDLETEFVMMEAK